ASSRLPAHVRLRRVPRQLAGEAQAGERRRRRRHPRRHLGVRRQLAARLGAPGGDRERPHGPRPAGRLRLDATESGGSVSLGIEVATGAVRGGTSILYAALGESIAQTAGVVNLGTEGSMLVGALAGYAITANTHNP